MDNWIHNYSTKNNYYNAGYTQYLMSKEEEVTNSAQECLGGFWDMRTFEPYFEKKEKMSRSRADGKEDNAFQAFFKTFHNI